MKNRWILLTLALIAVLAITLALTVGSTHLPVGTLLRVLAGDGDPMARDIVLQLRAPRAANAFCTGALLATAGVLMQVLLRNPLADPYVLGISGGAAVAALGAMLLGAAGWLINSAAAAGALGATFLVFALAHGRGGWTPQRLLLTGVVIAAGCSAIVSLMLALGDDAELRGMIFWLIGDMSFASFAPATVVILLLAVTLATLGARSLNVLARGETEAQTLGISLKPARMALFGGTALLTATAVTTAGGIGFVGLVTPHLVRLVAGSDHRIVVPASALLGGSLLTLADTAARYVAAPRQLPVGALTALIGVPVFLILMRRDRRVT
jgi:iron complex transport system permease protein